MSDMNPVLLAFLAGTLGGPIGGLAAWIVGITILRKLKGPVRGSLLAFSGGFIISVAFLELLERAIGESGIGWNLAAVVGGLAAGAAVRGFTTAAIGHAHPTAEGDEQEYRGNQARKIAQSLAVVNIVEGLTIGIGFAVGTRLGVVLAAVMIFENFTEGLSVSVELAQGEHSGRRIFLLTTLPTLTLGIGAAAGAWLGGLSQMVLTGLLGAGAGIMLYVVIDDVVYDAHMLGAGAITTVPMIAGTIAGIIVTAI